jgi:hypothetical protein
MVLHAHIIVCRMNNMLVGGRSSETDSHPIEMIDDK